MAESTPLTLTTITAPTVPLITGVNDRRDIDIIIDYLNTLVDYFVNCNIPISTAPIITATTTRVEGVSTYALDGGTFVPLSPIFWADGVHTIHLAFYKVPAYYSGGDLTFNLLREGAAAGTAVMNWAAYRFRDNTTIAAAVASTPLNFTPGDTNSHNIALTIPAAMFTVGDTLRVDVERLGADGGDTMVGVVQNRGFTVSFTGYKGIP